MSASSGLESQLPGTACPMEETLGKAARGLRREVQGREGEVNMVDVVWFGPAGVSEQAWLVVDGGWTRRAGPCLCPEKKIRQSRPLRR